MTSATPGLLRDLRRRFQRYLWALTLEELERFEEALPWYATVSERTERNFSYGAPAHFRQAQIYESLEIPRDLDLGLTEEDVVHFFFQVLRMALHRPGRE